MRKEMAKRRGEVTITWKRLSEFFKHGNCTQATKIRIYDAVIKAKLLYGLSTANLTKGLQEDLNKFQLKGLRQILKMDTTWGQKKNNEDMTNTNEEVIRRAEAAINHNRI